MFFLHTLYPFIKNYIGEVILLVLAISITGYSIISYVSSNKSVPQVNINESEEILPTEKISKKNITVDISGAVLKPDIYEVTEGARLAYIVELAGGLDTEADTGYIARNFNLAQYVSDQEKIYIPFKKDIQDGRFIESPKLLEYTNQQESNTNESTTNETTVLSISINSATKDELDMLPGVGPTTAQKIIDNRPYTTLDELLNKKVVKQSVFDDIQDQISL